MNSVSKTNYKNKQTQLFSKLKKTFKQTTNVEKKKEEEKKKTKITIQIYKTLNWNIHTLHKLHWTADMTYFGKFLS